MDATSVIERAVADLEPGGHLVDVVELTGGVSATVLGVEIVTSTGGRRRVVFRQHRTTEFKQQAETVTAMEYGVLMALHRAGLAVPEPYRCIDPVAGAAPHLVIEWVDGSTELATAELPAALDQMADFLIDLHALDTSSMQLPGLEPIEDPLTAVVPYLPSTGAGHHARAMLGSGWRRRGANRSVLLHGDYWPGNVLWRDGRLVAVVDWEDARLGDPLADLATARVELLCRYGTEAMERFTDRYLAAHVGTIKPLRLDSLVLWELYVSAAALATMGDWGLEPADEAHRRRCTQRFFDRAARQLD